MLGYIISDKNEIIVKNYEIQSFDILHKTDLNIFVIQNNKVLYKNFIILNASNYGHIQVLEWFKNSGYEFKYSKYAINRASYYRHIQIVEWFKKRNVKKVIKWSKPLKFLKTIKFKTHNKYLKGYQKN